MPTVNVLITDDMQAFVEGQINRGLYGSASDYVQSLIREAQKRAAKEALETKLAESLESGPATAMTGDDWADLRKRLEDRIAQGRRNSNE